MDHTDPAYLMTFLSEASQIWLTELKDGIALLPAYERQSQNLIDWANSSSARENAVVREALHNYHLASHILSQVSRIDDEAHRDLIVRTPDSAHARTAAWLVKCFPSVAV